MLLLVLECAPPKVYGYCSSWALQVATGVYVANLPAKQRDEIWDQIMEWASAETRALMIWPSPHTEQGLTHRSLGHPRRAVREIEGLLVSAWIPRNEEEIAPE